MESTSWIEGVSPVEGASWIEGVSPMEGAFQRVLLG